MQADTYCAMRRVVAEYIVDVFRKLAGIVGRLGGASRSG